MDTLLIFLTVAIIIISYLVVTRNNEKKPKESISYHLTNYGKWGEFEEELYHKINRNRHENSLSLLSANDDLLALAFTRTNFWLVMEYSRQENLCKHIGEHFDPYYDLGLTEIVELAVYGEQDVFPLLDKVKLLEPSFKYIGISSRFNYIDDRLTCVILAK